MAQELTRTQSLVDFKNGYCSEDNDILKQVRDDIYKATQIGLSSTTIVIHSCESHVVDTTKTNRKWIYCPESLLADCVYDLQLLLKEYDYNVSCVYNPLAELKISWEF